MSCFSCDHIFFNFSITVLRHPLVFELIYERICKSIKKIQAYTSKTPYILKQAGTSWNHLERDGIYKELSFTHTNRRRVLCVQYYCPTEYNIIRCVYLEPSGTSTLELFNCFAKMLHRKCPTGF